MKETHIAILGAGAFGFAMAKLLGDAHPEKKIILYDPVVEYIESISKTRQHPVFHKGIELKGNIAATTNLQAAVSGGRLIVLAIPAQLLRRALRDIKPHISGEVIFLNLAKALEEGTHKRMSQVIAEEMEGLQHPFHAATLSGGMIADEVARGNPLAAEIGCVNKAIARELQALFSSRNLRIEINDDIIGVELAGSFKNVVAIGAGFFDGLGYSASSKSAFISHASHEMKHIALALGAKEDTFGPGSQAWLGDLLTTCFGNSRNRYFGELLGKGHDAATALKMLEQEKKRAEGYATTKVIHDIILNSGLKSHAVAQVYAVLYEGKTAKQVVEDFMKAPTVFTS